MEIKKIIIAQKEILLIYIMFTVGIIGHLSSTTKELMLMLTPFTLLFLGALVLYQTIKASESKFILWIIIIYLFTFLVEVIGVKTALVFGNYNYGKTLGFKMFDVPLIIGLNWTLVILGSLVFVKTFSKNIFISSLLASLIAVIFDFIMEPVAIMYDYWNWTENIIPLQNYLAWFALAFIASTIFNLLKVRGNSKISIHYVIAQFVFFIVINFCGIN